VAVTRTKSTTLTTCLLEFHHNLHTIYPKQYNTIHVVTCGSDHNKTTELNSTRHRHLQHKDLCV